MNKEYTQINDNLSIHNDNIYNNTVLSDEDFTSNNLGGNNINNIQSLKKNLSAINEKEKEIFIKFNKFLYQKIKKK